jgi:hypothetical protein
MKTYFLTNR